MQTYVHTYQRTNNSDNFGFISEGNNGGGFFVWQEQISTTLLLPSPGSIRYEVHLHQHFTGAHSHSFKQTSITRKLGRQIEVGTQDEVIISKLFGLEYSTTQ